MSAVCLPAVTRCSTFDGRPQQKRTADYVQIGPQTYNTESHAFERPWPSGPNRINSSRNVDREVISKSGPHRALVPPISNIEDKVRRILRKIVSFGFLDSPQLDPPSSLDDTPSALEALNEAREGIVLLKNESHILPLDRNKMRSILSVADLLQRVLPLDWQFHLRSHQVRQ